MLRHGCLWLFELKQRACLRRLLRFFPNFVFRRLTSIFFVAVTWPFCRLEMTWSVLFGLQSALRCDLRLSSNGLYRVQASVCNRAHIKHLSDLITNMYVSILVDLLFLYM
jgi:hypothetical protein